MVLKSSQGSKACAGLFRREMRFADGFEAMLQNQFRVPDKVDLRARTGLLAISVRNPRFSNALIGAFCSTARECLRGGIVTIVDRPYERNVAASSGPLEEQRRKIEALQRVAAETRVRVDRIVAKHGGAISIEPWDALAAETPTWLRQSIRAAWDRRGLFYSDVLAQCSAVIPGKFAAAALEPYAEFLLEEIPVLLYVYYFRPHEVVDVYPGPQPVLFWRIEGGAYADEMPELANRLCERGGLFYAHVWMRIRLMRPTELDAVVGVWRRSLEKVQPQLNERTNSTDENAENHFLSSIGRPNDVWLAVEDGQILGFLAICGAEVNHIYVDPLSRRRGIGTALLGWAKTLSPSGVTVFAHEQNEVARAFCMRRGFRVVRATMRSVPDRGPEVELAWKPTDGTADAP